MDSLLNEYDMDLSVSDSFLNDDNENVVLSGETIVIGNITLWELAGIFLVSSVILSKNFKEKQLKSEIFFLLLI